MNQWGFILNEDAVSDNIFPILLSTAITFIGIAMMVVPGVLEDSAERKCKKIVEAECVDLKHTTVTNGDLAYAPVYQYAYNGNYYTKCTGKYKTTNYPKVGDKTELRINADKPEEVYIPAEKSSKMLIYIFGASFFIAVIGMLMTTLAS